MKRIWKWMILFAALSALYLLSGCQGNPLPEGMDESELLTRGREIVALLNAEDWQGVYDQLRSDGQETTSPEAIEEYMRALWDKSGAYVEETDAMATGQKLDSGEEYGTAVFYCKHQKKTVMYRIAFSTDMEFTGFKANKI